MNSENPIYLNTMTTDKMRKGIVWKPEWYLHNKSGKRHNKLVFSSWTVKVKHIEIFSSFPKKRKKKHQFSKSQWIPRSPVLRRRRRNPTFFSPKKKSFANMLDYINHRTVKREDKIIFSKTEASRYELNFETLNKSQVYRPQWGNCR